MTNEDHAFLGGGDHNIMGPFTPNLFHMDYSSYNEERFKDWHRHVTELLSKYWEKSN